MALMIIGIQRRRREKMVLEEIELYIYPESVFLFCQFKNSGELQGVMNDVR